MRDENKLQAISQLFIRKSLSHESLFLKPQLSVKYITKETYAVQHTSYFTEDTNLSRKVKIYIYNFEMTNQQNNSTCVRACLYSVGTQHWNLQQLSVMTSRVTYFILRAHTGTRVSHS